MKVILTKEVLGLGDPGQVVNVKNGYGRNYLIPQSLAIEATKSNVALVEAEKRRIEAALAKEAEAMKSEADKLNGVKLSLKRKTGEAGKLYGSVTNMDLGKELAAQGFEIDRRRIVMDGPIKSVGEHMVKIKLHPQVVVEISVTVESENPPPEPKAPKAEVAEDAAEGEVEAADAEESQEAEGEAAPEAEEEEPKE